MAKTLPKPRGEVYKDIGTFMQRWRWRLVARNGRVVAIGGEAYARPSGAAKAFNRSFEIYREARPYTCVVIGARR